MINPFRKTSVRLKLFLTYLMLFTLPLLLIGAISLFWMSGILQENSRKSFENMLDHARQTIDGKLDAMNGLAYQLSNTMWIRKIMYMKKYDINEDNIDAFTLNEYDQQLQTYKIVNSFMNEIAIYFNNSDIVLYPSARRDSEWFFGETFKIKGMDLEKWKKVLNVQNQMKINPYTQVDLYGRKKTGLLYLQSLPVDAFSNIKATLIIFVQNQELEQILDSLFIDKGVGLLLLDNGGNAVFSKGMDKEVLDAVMVKIGNKLVEASNTGIATISQKDGHTLFLTQSSKYKWKYIVTVPDSVIMKNAMQVRIIILCILLLSIGIGVVLSFEMASRNYKPLANVIESIRNMHSPGMIAEKGNEFEWLQQAVNSIVIQEKTLSERLEQQKPLIRRAYLNRLFDAGFTPDDTYSMALELLDVRFCLSDFCCLAVSSGEAKVELLDEILDNIRLQRDESVYRTKMEDNLVIISNFAGQYHLEELLQLINNAFLSSGEMMPTIGVGTIYKGLNGVGTSYREALQALDYRQIKGRGCIIYFEDIRLADRNYYYPADKENCIANYLKSGDYENAIRLLDEILEKNFLKENISPMSIRNLFTSMELTAMRVIDEKKLENVMEVMETKREDAHESVSYNEMASRIQVLYFWICSHIKDNRENQNDHLKLEILSYIDQNYANRCMSLGAVAGKFGLSPSYLSRYFKEQLGSNFLDYLNRRRIQMSKKLLAGKPMDICIIAKSVGYETMM